MNPITVNVFHHLSPEQANQLKDLERKIDKHMASIDDQLQNIEDKLTEAKDEILAEIAKLQGEQLSASAKAALARIETQATGLADIVSASEPPGDLPPPSDV